MEKEFLYRLAHHQKYTDIIKEIENSKKIYLTKDNFHVIPLTHLGKEFKELELHDGFDAIYDHSTQKELIKSISNNLFKLTKRQIKHYQTKINKLLLNIKEAKDADKLKEYGDYLFMHGNLNHKGLKEIIVANYEGEKIKISLNPKLSIKENANKYYHQYQKLKKGIIYQKKELLIAKDELEYFKSINEQLNFSNYEDALEIKNELENKGYIKINKKLSKKKKKQKSTPNIYQLNFNDKTIIYGKNNLQNAYVTFKLSLKNHTFFHAQGWHGAHVVINSDELNEEEIRLCAQIAAYFSGARGSSSIPVDYCLIKDTKKISGAKLSIKNQKTIYIDIDEELLNKLGII